MYPASPFKSPDLYMIRVVAKLNLLYLLAESQNFRNDGWVQQGYREKYREALREYIVNYTTLTDLGRK